MKRNHGNGLSRFFGDRSGAVAVIFAVAAPAIVGFTALGVEVGLWYQIHAKLQAIADAAAIAGARELAAGTGKTSQAVSSAGELNGCTEASECTLDSPTTFRTASSPSSDNGVQVVAHTPITFLMAGYFLPTDADGRVDVSATGKAAYTTQTVAGGTTACVLGLDNNAAYTVWLKNNATLNCGAMSNSRCQGKNSTTCTLDKTVYGSYSCSSSVDPQCNASLSDSSLSSLYLSNNAQINTSAAAGGLIYLSNNAKITGTKTSNSTQVTDPYAALTISAPTTSASPTIGGGSGSSSAQAIDISIGSSTCSSGALTYANNKYINIHPGCYNGWDFKNNVYLTLYAGTYYIKTKFSIQNNAVITATNGTTIVFVGSGASSYAIDISNNAQLNITAPTSGTYSGIALMGDPDGKETIVQTFSNNAILNIKGAIYFRKQILNLENNAMSSSTGCLQLIARRVLFSNNATIGTNCSGVGTTDVTIGQQVQKIVDIVE
jgi:Flp pilus assembly protein TadG